MKTGRWLVLFFLFVSMSAASGTTIIGTASQLVPAAAPAPACPRARLAPAFAEIPLYFIPNAGQFDNRVAFCAKTSSYTLWATAEGLVFDAVWREKAETRALDGDDGETRPRPAKVPPPVKRDVSRLVFPGGNESVTARAGASSGHRVNYFLGNDPALWREGVETHDAILYEDLYPGIDLKVYGVEKAIEYDWIVGPGADVGAVRFEYRDVRGTRIDPGGNLVVTTSFGELVHKKPVAYQTAAGGRDSVDVCFKRLDGGAYGFDAGPYDPSRELVIDPVILVYSSFLGGRDWDRCGDIAVDESLCLYVAGATFSTDFPLKAGYDPTYNNQGDVFVTKFSSTGKSLVYSTYLGGPYYEQAYGLTVDKTKNVYFGGIAYDGFPTKNAYDDSYDDSKHGDYFDAILVKLNALGNLVYSTYLGKGDDDAIYSVAVDGVGRAHVAGDTDNLDFPVKYAIQPHFGGNDDGFVAVFSASGNSLETSTFIGGSMWDGVADIALDKAGFVYICGTTRSSDFPTKKAYDATYGGGLSDAYYAKLGPLARSRVFTTFLGGNQSDNGIDIALDASLSAYIVGSTQSKNFPKVKAYDKTLGGTKDGFVVKFAPNGLSLLYATFIGGSEDDAANQVALDGEKAAYVAGSTLSSDFPCLDAYDDSYNGYSDVFVLKLAPSGSSLVFSTFLGGSLNDNVHGLCLDRLNAIYLGGQTYSSDFPVRNAFDNSFNGGEFDVYVTKLKLKLK